MRRLLLVPALVGCVLILGCGLDTFHYLDAPLNDGHTAYYTSSDYTQNYFSFVTNETSGENSAYFNSSSEFAFLGTEVYYKIYTSYSAMLSSQSSIASLANSSNSSQAAERMIGSLGYKPLKQSDGASSPLIPALSSPSNRYVYIRLDSYNSNEYRACICIGSSRMTSYSAENNRSQPRRAANLGWGFTFNASDSANPIPKSDDSDVQYTSFSEKGKWYVDMYAVSVGRDSSYTISYSRPLLLGSITIEEK